MMQLLVKALLSGAIVAIASEVSRRSSLAGAIIVSLPLTSILALAWLYRDTGDAAKVRDLSWSILWVVVPSIAFFVALPVFLRIGWAVPPALAGAILVTAVAYPVWIVVARRLGLDL